MERQEDKEKDGKGSENRGKREKRIRKRMVKARRTGKGEKRS
jgi:hypothetical protein